MRRTPVLIASRQIRSISSLSLRLAAMALLQRLRTV
jgi:hypothetical protein